jgi:Helix-turn-helix domain
MPESFGARLRHQRERQQIALTFIAEKTKIHLSLLEALERDDVSQWPTGIFRRSFVRDYARLIGLEPDPVVREFLELHPDHVNEILPEPVLDIDSGSPRPPIRLRYLVASAIRGIRARLESLQIPDGARDAAIDRDVQGYAAARTLPTAAPPPSPASTAHVPPPPAETRQEEPESSVVREFSPVTELCAELDRATGTREVGHLLDDATRILEAKGLVIWTWDPQASALKPTRVHGYPVETAARLPIVRRDADNATAASFRSAEICVVAGSDHGSSAVVAPLLTPAGCLGVLAIELQPGGEQQESVRFLATRLAARVAASVVNSPPIAEVAAAVNT